MERNFEIQQELEHISRLVASIPRADVLQVPDDYFGCLPERMMRKAGQGKSLWEIPANYFDGIARSVLNQIQTEDAAGNPQTPLTGIQRKHQPFLVPDQYFDTVPERINTRITSVDSSTKTRIVSMRFRQTIRYMAAAVITLIITTGVFRFITGRSTTSPASTNLESSIEQGRQMNEQQFSEQLNKLNEDDILSYLEEYGTPQDVARLGSGMENGDIPSSEEYLKEENTLDHLLQILPSEEQQKN
jgi:hypothetical protein